MITVRIGVIGESAVGKTTLVKKFTGSDVSYLSPINIAIRPLHFQIRGRNVGLCISIYDFLSWSQNFYVYHSEYN